MIQAPAFFSDLAHPRGARIALCVQYDGSPYVGWQLQPHLPHLKTVQGELERALGSICAAPVRVHCAGRTDSGVHGIAQWVHFNLPAQRSLKACVIGTNGLLPASVRVTDACVVPQGFHARHSARSRTYDYLVINAPVYPALLVKRALWVREPLDVSAMESALQALLGEQDFSAFRASACQSRTPMRYLSEVQVLVRGEYLQFRVRANAFLHHMVRNIVGSALEVGKGEQSADWLGELLHGRDRSKAGPTAPAHGLYLTAVEYPREFSVPAVAAPPFLLS